MVLLCLSVCLMWCAKAASHMDCITIQYLAYSTSTSQEREEALMSNKCDSFVQIWTPRHSPNVSLRYGHHGIHQLSLQTWLQKLTRRFERWTQTCTCFSASMVPAESIEQNPACCQLTARNRSSYDDQCVDETHTHRVVQCMMFDTKLLS